MPASPPETESAAATFHPPRAVARASGATDAAVALTATDCLTPFGDARATTAALLRGESALCFQPVLGRDGGDAVPLALLNDWQPEGRR